MAEKQGNDENVNDRACILPHPRVGDAYRELAAERLCEYRAGGFLDQDEFEARRDIILSAKTADEVECMFTDLHSSLLPRPAQVPPPPAPPATRQRRQRMHPAGIWFWAMMLLTGVLLGSLAAGAAWLFFLAGMMLAGGMLLGVIMTIREIRGKTRNRVDRCDGDQ